MPRQEFSDWFLALLSDNCPTYHRIDSILGLPIEGCNSHKLNLEVNRFFKKQNDIKQALLLVNVKMKYANMNLKNRTFLRNITDLTTQLHNQK